MNEDGKNNDVKPLILPTSIRDLLIYAYLLLKGGSNELVQEELLNLRESNIKEIQLVNKIKAMIEDKFVWESNDYEKVDVYEEKF